MIGEDRGPSGALTTRELDYLSRLALGRMRRDIAASDGISYQRVQQVVDGALHKLGVESLIEAFVKLGWLRAGRMDQ